MKKISINLDIQLHRPARSSATTQHIMDCCIDGRRMWLVFAFWYHKMKGIIVFFLNYYFSIFTLRKSKGCVLVKYAIFLTYSVMWIIGNSHLDHWHSTQWQQRKWGSLWTDQQNIIFVKNERNYFHYFSMWANEVYISHSLDYTNKQAISLKLSIVRH